jgi:hypothetical protein
MAAREGGPATGQITALDAPATFRRIADLMQQIHLFFASHDPIVQALARWRGADGLISQSATATWEKDSPWQGRDARALLCPIL